MKSVLGELRVVEMTEEERSNLQTDSSKRRLSELVQYVPETNRGWHVSHSTFSKMRLYTVHTLPKLSSCANSLSPPPPLRNRPTHSRDASMGSVVVMERGWQWPDLETLLPRRPLEGAEGSCRQSADALWVNPFKHDSLTSLLLSLFLSQWRESLPLPMNFRHFAVRGCWWKTPLSYSLCLISASNAESWHSKGQAATVLIRRSL